MAILKQKKIGGRTYKLHQRKTDRSGKQYEYYVSEDGNQIGDPVYTRDRGMDEWRETINAIQRAEGEDRNESRGMGLGVQPQGIDVGQGDFGFSSKDDDDSPPWMF